MVSKLSVGYGLSRQVRQFAISCPLYLLTDLHQQGQGPPSKGILQAL